MGSRRVFFSCSLFTGYIRMCYILLNTKEVPCILSEEIPSCLLGSTSFTVREVRHYKFFASSLLLRCLTVYEEKCCFLKQIPLQLLRTIDVFADVCSLRSMPANFLSFSCKSARKQVLSVGLPWQQQKTAFPPKHFFSSW